MNSLEKSASLWSEAQTFIPCGVHSDSRWSEPHPLYIERASGAYLWDVDGNKWMDCKMGNGARILGHAVPEVNKAVGEAMRKGLGAGYETALSVRAARRLSELVGGERVRFANTGTEAAMHALLMARAKTGRERIAKSEGSYHGWYDFLFVSSWAASSTLGSPDAPASPPGSAGLSRHAAETIVVPFNDLDNTVRLLRENRDELAAFILEPTLIDVGYVPATREYLAGIREVTGELGIVLIFDELLTGFRLPGNSAAAYYEVEPDLSLFGKAIGNGHIVAAVAGKRQLLEVDPSPQYVGTFNSHGVSMAAVDATLQVLSDGKVLKRLDSFTEQLSAGIRALGQEYNVPVQLQGGGGHFHVYFNPEPVTDYRSAQASSPESYSIFAEQLRADGILIAGKYLLHSALSFAHTEADVEQILESSARAFHKIKEGQ